MAPGHTSEASLSQLWPLTQEPLCSIHFIAICYEKSISTLLKDSRIKSSIIPPRALGPPSHGPGLMTRVLPCYGSVICPFSLKLQFVGSLGTTDLRLGVHTTALSRPLQALSFLFCSMLSSQQIPLRESSGPISVGIFSSLFVPPECRSCVVVSLAGVEPRALVRLMGTEQQPGGSWAQPLYPQNRMDPSCLGHSKSCLHSDTPKGP